MDFHGPFVEGLDNPQVYTTYEYYDRVMIMYMYSTGGHPRWHFVVVVGWRYRDSVACMEMLSFTMSRC